ncbi:MAG: hypothetical protein AAGA21_08735 [Pseudomonadota bacterium]
MAKGGADGETIPSGTFGRGGHRRVLGSLSFEGRLGPAFAQFAQTRARRLSLTGSIRYDATHAVVSIEGPEALVGAFEMACIIGPETCSIDNWSWHATDPSTADSDNASDFDDHLDF